MRTLGHLKMRPHCRKSHFDRTIFYSLILFSFLKNVSPQVLTPPYFNLAEGRRILATATCGEGVPEPELYCKLVGADEKELHVENIIAHGQVKFFWVLSRGRLKPSDSKIGSPRGGKLKKKLPVVKAPLNLLSKWFCYYSLAKF